MRFATGNTLSFHYDEGYAQYNNNNNNEDNIKKEKQSDQLLRKPFFLTVCCILRPRLGSSFATKLNGVFLVPNNNVIDYLPVMLEVTAVTNSTIA